MRILNPISFEQANAESREIFTQIQKGLGTVPNLYAAMGVSDKLLGGFLAFTETLKHGEFSKKEYEAIALATSQVNGCEYCLAAHTTLAKMNGFTEGETLDIRLQEIADPKVRALVVLVTQLAEKKGKPTEEALQDFFNAGYNKAAFAELIGAVALTTITNTVFHNGGFEIDFPLAKNIETSSKSINQL